MPRIKVTANLNGFSLDAKTPALFTWKGWALYREKQRIAKAYPSKSRASREFQRLVDEYNGVRATEEKRKNPKAAVSPLQIAVPEYSDEELERDTIRGFNGYTKLQMHEYRPKMQDRLLDLSVEKSGASAIVIWERVSAAERIAEYDRQDLPLNRRGDPNYVSNVEARQSF